MGRSNEPSTAPMQERLALGTVLPRAWQGFSSAPWPCVRLSCLILGSAAGLGLLAQELAKSSNPWVRHGGDIVWGLSIVVPLTLLLGLMRLADTLLTNLSAKESNAPKTKQGIPWLLRQSVVLTLIEACILVGTMGALLSLFYALLSEHSGVLAFVILLTGGLTLTLWTVGQCLALPLLIHHGHKPWTAMKHSHRLVQDNRLKIYVLLGLLVGLNVIGLLGLIGLLITLPLSALILMASCRTQTP
ncbi:MAG: hypothetical protein ACON4T_06645 [Synechococcus sp.]